ncbi:hypothetical protein YTPLAS18_39010 [Nitrospira sp.]|nr:hypothetical protein YTPLAS18_39010 [Nitrospira sp.]
MLLRRLFVVVVCLTVHTPLVGGQGLPPADLPPDIRIPIQEMAFEEPTTIEGRVLYLDTYDEALWVEWTRVQDSSGWRAVPGQRQFVLYPKDPAIMDILKRLPKESVIRLRIQREQGGKRMILALDEL